MAVVTQCPDCGKKLKAAEAQVGKKAKCPQCQKPFEIRPIEGAEPKVAGSAPQPQKKSTSTPAPAPAPKRPAAAGPAAAAVQPREDWYLQTADGEEYGPVSRSELDDWFAEGRIDTECQLLREGWDQWKWAEEVFPELTGGDGGGEAATEDNPFANLAAASPAAADPFTGIAATATAPAANPYAAPSAAAAVETAEGGGAVSRAMIMAMRQTKPWVLLFTVLTGLATAIMSVTVLFSLLALLTDVVAGMVMFLFYGTYTGIYGYTAFLLYKYFDTLGKFERNADAPSLEKALVAQKNFWKFCGIMALIAIGLTLLFVLLMVFVVGMGAMGAMGGGAGPDF